MAKQQGALTGQDEATTRPKQRKAARWLRVGWAKELAQTFVRDRLRPRSASSPWHTRLPHLAPRLVSQQRIMVRYHGRCPSPQSGRAVVAATPGAAQAVHLDVTSTGSPRSASRSNVNCRPLGISAPVFVKPPRRCGRQSARSAVAAGRRPCVRARLSAAARPAKSMGSEWKARATSVGAISTCEATAPAWSTPGSAAPKASSTKGTRSPSSQTLWLWL